MREFADFPKFWRRAKCALAKLPGLLRVSVCAALILTPFPVIADDDSEANFIKDVNAAKEEYINKMNALLKEVRPDAEPIKFVPFQSASATASAETGNAEPNEELENALEECKKEKGTFNMAEKKCFKEGDACPKCSDGITFVSDAETCIYKKNSYDVLQCTPTKCKSGFEPKDVVCAKTGTTSCDASKGEILDNLYNTCFNCWKYNKVVKNGKCEDCPSYHKRDGDKCSPVSCPASQIKRADGTCGECFAGMAPSKDQTKCEEKSEAKPAAAPKAKQSAQAQAAQSAPAQTAQAAPEPVIDKTGWSETTSSFDSAEACDNVLRKRHGFGSEIYVNCNMLSVRDKLVIAANPKNWSVMKKCRLEVKDDFMNMTISAGECSDIPKTYKFDAFGSTTCSGDGCFFTTADHMGNMCAHANGNLRTGLTAEEQSKCARAVCDYAKGRLSKAAEFKGQGDATVKSIFTRNKSKCSDMTTENWAALGIE